MTARIAGHSHLSRCRSLTGVPVPPLVPGSPEWLATMSASKVAAVLGLSPYTSRFELWHRMAGNLPREDDKAAFTRGHLLEPAVCAWLAMQHPDLKVVPTGSWQHPELTWATANPDRLALAPRTRPAVVQVKTDNVVEEWGPDGSDEIPPGYRAQVLWEMFVTGARVAHVAVLLPFLEFRRYVVSWDESEAAYIVDRASEFMTSLGAGEAPALDSSTHTYQALRLLHPDIDGTTVELDEALAVDLVDANAASKAATEHLTLAKSRVLAAMGTAKHAEFLGTRLASRSAKGDDGVPYLTLSRSMPSALTTGHAA